jgi:hypothetical protein
VQIIEEEKKSETSPTKKAEAPKEEEFDPPSREVLPFFKDPKIKISVWTIIKDSIGKDLTKMSVPVYFNDPANILQKCATSVEYVDIVVDAIKCKDQIGRASCRERV